MYRSAPKITIRRIRRHSWMLLILCRQLVNICISAILSLARDLLQSTSNRIRGQCRTWLTASETLVHTRIPRLWCLSRSALQTILGRIQACSRASLTHGKNLICTRIPAILCSVRNCLQTAFTRVQGQCATLRTVSKRLIVIGIPAVLLLLRGYLETGFERLRRQCHRLLTLGKQLICIRIPEILSSAWSALQTAFNRIRRPWWMQLIFLKKELVFVGIPAILSLSALVLLIPRYGALPVLGVAILISALLLLFIWPEIATLVVVFVLFSNLAVVAVQQQGVPELAAASVSLLLGLPLAHYLIVRRERLRADGIFVLMLLFLLVLLMSSFFAKDLGLAARRIGTFAVEGLAVYLLMINVVRSLTTLRRVIWVLLLAGSVLGTLSVYQVMTHSYGQQFGGLAQRHVELEIDEGEVAGINGARNGAAIRATDRAQGPIGDPNRYAQVLIVLLPFAFFRFRDERSRSLRLCALAAGGLILCGVLLSYSRGAFLTLALLLALMTFKRYIRPLQIVTSVLLLIILVAAVAPGYYQRMGTILGAKGLVVQDSSVQADYVTRGRTTEMLAALTVFLDHPFLGVGPGQYTPFYSVTYQQDPDIAFRQINKPRRAHNLYFEMAAETGLIGLAVFMAIILVVMRRLLQARRRWVHSRPDLANLATALWLSILAYLGTSVFLHLAYERYYWLLVAMAGAALQIFRSESARGSEKEEEVPGRPEWLESSAQASYQPGFLIKAG